MRPILFHIGSAPVYSYGFFVAVAFVVGTIFGIIQAKRRGISIEAIIDIALYSCIAGIVGARIVYVLLDLPVYLSEPMEILRLRDGGLSFHGGLFTAILVGIWYCRRHKVSAWEIADIAAPSVALGYSIARIGCFLNGCCFGVTTNLPWALKCAAYDQSLRHPTQIYAAIGSLMIFAILMISRKSRHFPGYLMFFYVFLYSILRFVVEIFRDVPRFLGPLSITQVVSIVLALGSFLCISILSNQAAKPEEKLPAQGR
ncbi:MAG: prolipoprotein diacylglyceryl transferase [Firmicutes bacterium]|nr:prolipoprotein diacylglyceryl transferase [Bacillota bacterium]